MACTLLLAAAVVAGCAVGLSGATDHIVGANHGWNPNINYSLWSGNQTFYVNDLICKLSKRPLCRNQYAPTDWYQQRTGNQIFSASPAASRSRATEANFAASQHPLFI